MSPRYAYNLREEAILRELASLNIWCAEASRLCGIDQKYALQYAKRGKWKWPARGVRPTKLHAFVRAGYAAKKRPHQIWQEAVAMGLCHSATDSSIKVLASHMRITSQGRDPYEHKRGFAVPIERREEWRELRRIGCSTKEAGFEMGLIQRAQ